MNHSYCHRWCIHFALSKPTRISTKISKKSCSILGASRESHKNKVTQTTLQTGSLRSTFGVVTAFLSANGSFSSSSSKESSSSSSGRAGGDWVCLGGGRAGTGLEALVFKVMPENFWAASFSLPFSDITCNKSVGKLSCLKWPLTLVHMGLLRHFIVGVTICINGAI